MKITRFEDLPIWKDSLKITKIIYDITSTTKLSKDFALRDQLRRAVISISSNIAEGFEKNNNNEFIRYLKIAKGSIGEVRNQVYIAHSIDYIDDSEFEKINKQLQNLANQVGAFITYLETARQKGKFTKRAQFVNK